MSNNCSAGMSLVKSTMADFDRMPKHYREAFANADHNWGAVNIFSIRRKLGRDFNIELFLAEADDTANAKAAAAGQVLRQDRMVRIKQAQNLLEELGL